MKRNERIVALVVAVPGLAAVLTAIALFLVRFQENRIPWAETYGRREHFMAVGGAWARGLAMGFFLCFFLVLGGAALGDWRAARKARRENR